MPLTNAAVHSCKPSDKTRKLFDGGGLYLEVSPKGHKWWRWKYRFANKEKRLSFGVYPAVSLKDARAKRDEARRVLASGADPAAQRKAQRAALEDRSANRFEVVAREWFEQRRGNWAESHAVRTIRLLERDIFPWIGRLPVAEVNAPKLLEVVRRIEQRGAAHTSHRALQVCGQVFRYAVATARAERDPSGDLRGALPPVKVEHFPSITEPSKLANVLRAFDGYQGTPVVRCALRLAPLLFVRPGELRHAEWAEINTDAAEWRFTVTKTRTLHIVPLARQAIHLLRELEPITGGGRYVFPSARSPRGDRPMSDNAILAAMRNMGVAKEEMTGHGFRASARTILDEVLGFPPHLIEHQLAHAVRDPLGRAYNRTAHLAERRVMMQTWADYLDGLKCACPHQSC
ncbi:MAG: integrase arm-type DNA-binding domain-containing protein [Gammaproteobacteria bacterium]|nr:integrase arm-type DNA-binding domain-containing protein [Gammaproteobacteria bacterium]